MGSWVRTIAFPFRKARAIFSHPREKKSQTAVHDHQRLKLHGEVMACSYEDVHVLWSILDKSRLLDQKSSS
ncbi:uncharacterized protein LOC109709709 [Ananas comosus]|uniref:Uncharacterized protein LOC109709709 n=1 Tax=Ananas comosus TaxID=4615 RepID=A0A199V9L7_ANACO|nr:uncharacterized protein LOC109709709 [Ananas comosus]OAY73571.1 hypothetical protein ACMD2_02510 [Ananas comosus]